jgi:uncharacterized protein
MQYSASFFFKGELEDFLNMSEKNNVISYHFNEHPSIKDAIEAIGIPHTEVDTIIVNGFTVNFNYLLKNNDEVRVHPYRKASLSRQLKDAPKFILDVHLGKLARLVRLLGFDACYQNNYTDKQIVELAITGSRIVLTRDVGLLKHKALQYGYWLRSQYAEEQLAEVIKRYDLIDDIKPFTRCIACNGKIVAVSKENVLDIIPPKTKQYFNEFYKCVECNRVYWKGSHYERMQQFIDDLKLSSKIG